MQQTDIKLDKLLEKYGGAVPRYTSYPTAPEWKTVYLKESFETAISKSNSDAKNYSLYLHLPFCESQCYYCACNVIISKKHEIATAYIERLKEEIEYIGSQISPERKVIQMAWGGGTPTFLHPAEIEDIYNHIKRYFNLLEPQDEKVFNHEYSIEVDPRVTSFEHLQMIAKLGFNRLSMGIQDFNLETQEAIHRHQSPDLVYRVVSEARGLGFSSINFDLIYGLPYQTIESFDETLEQVTKLSPDRIALFNYAHIPEVFSFQRKYIKDSSLPDQGTKLAIFKLAVEKLCAAGYEFIGLDHFARPDDELSKAHKSKKLYRNFQGYTTHDGCDLFGLGLTAISSVQGVYKQNKKRLSEYYDTEDSFSAEKFFISNENDLERKEIIKEIMCHCYTELDYKKYKEEYEQLKPFMADALLDLQLDDSKQKFSITVTELGRLFVRNIASVFDHYLKQKDAHRVFSKAL